MLLLGASAGWGARGAWWGSILLGAREGGVPGEHGGEASWNYDTRVIYCIIGSCYVVITI